MLPIAIRLPTKNLDADVLAILQQLLGVMSPELAKGLLVQRRVLVIADGISETSDQDMTALQPDKGSSFVHALVVTSRRPTELPESLLIRPQAVNLMFLDRILDDLVASTIGAGVLSAEQRELLRDRMKAMMTSTHGGEQFSVPMIFLKVMVDRANRLLRDARL
jgi:hypothetical protein